jgi:ketosteroid isomerase-like protein
MKTKKSLTILVFILSTITLMAQKSETTKTVKETITKFAKAADEQDSAALSIVLDENFRLTLNQLFGSTTTTIIDKKMYLEKIAAKEFGGDKREVTIDNVVIVGNNASAQATFKGAKMTIVTLLQLLKTSDGKWKIVNDLPAVQ